MLKSVHHRQSDALTRISWQDFERLLAGHYGDLGYEVEHHGTGSSGARSDGGIDLKLRKDAEFILVQCKHWNAMQVPHNDVHQLMGVMDNEDATGAILVTSGEFTVAARAAADKKGRVQLVDGVALRQMLGARLPPELPQNIAWKNVPERAVPRLVSNYGRRGRSQRSTSSIKKVAVSVVGLAIMIALFLIVGNYIQNVVAGMGSKASTAASAAQRPVSARNFSPERANVSNTSASRHEDAPSPATAAEVQAANAARIEAQQRANAESMKILEATTPELKR